MRTWWPAALCAGLLACGQTPPDATEHAAPSVRSQGPASAHARTLGKVRTRNATLVLTSSADGVRFDVEGNDGRTIARGVDESELRRTSPELFGIYKNATARSFVDARLDVPPSHESDTRQTFDVLR